MQHIEEEHFSPAGQCKHVLVFELHAPHLTQSIARNDTKALFQPHVFKEIMGA